VSSTVPKDGVQTSGASHTRLSPPPASPCGHSRWFVVHSSDRHLSTFLRSLRSPGVTPLHRYYGRSDFVRGGSSAWKRHELRFIPQPISLLSALGFLTVLSPTICVCPKAAGISPVRSLDAREFCSPDRLRPCSVGSPNTADRIEFTLSPSSETLLRTGHSLPVAPHPVLPRRSYSSIQHASSAHRSGLPPLQPSAITGAQSTSPLGTDGISNPSRHHKPAPHALHFRPSSSEIASHARVKPGCWVGFDQVNLS